ncbi:MAG: metallophosphoesterase, partial [Tissierellia bacterium]|nr:metallophosphoesterase [Tissierellia bacterium]
MNTFFTKKRLISFLLALVLILSSALPLVKATDNVDQMSEESILTQAEDTKVVDENTQKLDAPETAKENAESTKTLSQEQTEVQEAQVPEDKTERQAETLEEAPLEATSEAWMEDHRDKILEVNSHVGADSRMSQIITWTQFISRPSTIRVTDQEGKLVVEKEVEAVSNGKVYNSSLEVKNLNSNTTYLYSIDNGIEKVSGSFKTAKNIANKESVRFAMIADPQVRTEANAKATGALLKEISNLSKINSYDALYIAGDHTDRSDNESQWFNLFHNGGTSPNSVQEFLLNNSLISTQGNHDKSDLTGHVNTPNEAGLGVYDVDFGQVKFIILNNASYDTKDLANNVDFQAQVSFLREKVAEAKENDQWTLVGFHKPIYTGASHIDDNDVIAYRKALNPIFTELNVDMVLAGHDHVYSRGFIDRDGKLASSLNEEKTAERKYQVYSSVENAPLHLVAEHAGGLKWYKPVDYQVTEGDPIAPNYEFLDVNSAQGRNPEYSKDRYGNTPSYELKDQTFVDIEINGDEAIFTTYKMHYDTTEDKITKELEVYDKFSIIKERQNLDADRLTLLERDAQWSYNDTGIDLGKEWMKDTDVSNWKKGSAPLGFGDDFSETDPSLALATETWNDPNGQNQHMTQYFHTEFELPKLDGFKGLEFYIHVDDGAAVYLNGKEIFRKGIAEGIEIDYNTSAKFKPKEETFTIGLNELKDLLKEGRNEIAAEVHQSDTGSSDLWFELGIVAVKEFEEVIDWSKTPLPNPDVEFDGISRFTMSYHGSYNNMGFNWLTNQASVGSDVQILEGEKEAKDFENSDALLAFSGSFDRLTSDPQFIVHKAVAKNLAAGKTYSFRVGDKSLNKWSEVGSFTTDDKDGEFTFINLADSQAKTHEEAVLSAETFRKATQTVKDHEFLLINGDIVDTGSKEEQWGWVLDESKDVLYKTPFMAVAGNHEDDLNSFYEHFNFMPAEGSDTKSGVYYSYDYENTHFIMLNTNEDSDEYRNFTPAQIEWLKKDAKEARDRGVDWVIVTMHKGPYTTSNHATDKDIMDANGVRNLVAPLLAEIGADLVLQGHDHIYALSKPINKELKAQNPVIEAMDYRGQKVEYIVNPDGSVYMIPNTAGPKVYYKNKKIDESYYDNFINADENPAARYATEEDTSRPPRSLVQNFVEINVTKDKISALVYEIDQRQNAIPTIVDTFGLFKKIDDQQV